MKALTDKIIDCLKHRHEHFIGKQTNEITQAENKGFKQGLQWAIGSIESLESSAEFDEIARVMMKHLANPEKYHPHHRVVMDSTNADEKIKRDAELKLQAEAREKALAEKKAKNAPDKTKLLNFMQSIIDLPRPEIRNLEVAQILTNANTMLVQTANYIRDNANKL